MNVIKINQKDYPVPELTFKHLPMMEKAGLSLTDAASGKYPFTTAQVFTCIVVGCETDEADYLLEQHLLGGGTIKPIYKAFITAMHESHFFKKMLERGTKNPETPAENN